MLFQSAPPHGGRPTELEEVWLDSECFNPRPRTGGDDLLVLRIARPEPAVSIRAPARGATSEVEDERSGHQRFQSAPPHGGRPATSAGIHPVSLFQSAPPHGGRRTVPPSCRTRARRFNPRPRTGGDARPTCRPSFGIAFQSAPPHGGRLARREPCWNDSGSFQSAPPHGGRPASAASNGCGRNVFQSAPPHGGRPAHPMAQPPSARFNPRPRTGGDEAITEKLPELPSLSFNPRPRTGGDPVQSAKRPPRLRCFNPRPRTGGDAEDQAIVLSDLVFQSAPPHGGRPRAGGVREGQQMFQSAPPHGGRRSPSSSSTGTKRFQSAPPHGGRPVQFRLVSPLEVVSIRAPARGATTRIGLAPVAMRFQSAPPHGGRPGSSSVDRSDAGGRFNPRPRTGGDDTNPDRRPPKTIRAPARGATSDAMRRERPRD